MNASEQNKYQHNAVSALNVMGTNTSLPTKNAKNTALAAMMLKTKNEKLSVSAFSMATPVLSWSSLKCAQAMKIPSINTSKMSSSRSMNLLR